MTSTISSTSNKDTWKIIELIKWGEEFLSSKGIKNSRKETEWFLAHILQCDRINLYVRFDEVMKSKNLRIFKSCILRRLKHEPFQYIINTAPFYGRDFFVDENVLIPRPETETIIDLLKSHEPTDSLLDVGTGSGCIAITASLEKLAKNIVAIDKSEAALKIAQKNASDHSIDNIVFLKSDFLNDIPNQKFDIVVSNPPYIAETDISSLEPDIKDFEPFQSLTDNEDGLLFFKQFSQKANELLNDSGLMFLEFGGEPQVPALKNIFTKNKFNVTIHNDINKNPRVLEVLLND